MLILKIMSNQDLPDADPSKEFRLICDVKSVRFATDNATDYERTLMGYPPKPEIIIQREDESDMQWERRRREVNSIGVTLRAGESPKDFKKRCDTRTAERKKGREELIVSFAHVTIAVPGAPVGKREEVYLLTGNCYVLNDRGKTIESFWARRNPQGEQVGEE